MLKKDKRAPRNVWKRIERRLIAAWCWPSMVVLVGAGLILAALYPWPAAVLLVPFNGMLALVCWIERRRASRLAAQAAEWQSLLAPYLPALPALVSQLEEAASQMEGAVLQACDGFHGIGAKAREAVGAHGHGQGLEREILRVVVALQFQDIVNQRITHAIETLTELGEDLGVCLEQMPQDSNDRPKSDAGSASGPDRSCALEAKSPGRSGHNGAMKGPSQHEPKGSIELFLPEVGP